MRFNAFKQTIKKVLPRQILEALVGLRDQSLPKVPNLDIYARYVEGKDGIEIGGPSALFRKTLPIYQKIKNLDGVNFSISTVWEGNITSGLTYKFIGNKVGKQLISDGTDLSEIPSKHYDFVLSSNCLEHIANPLKALSEWKRILKDDGAILLVLPNKKSNFDHNRPTTSFEHIAEDLNRNMSERDLTHLDEILKLHDLSMDLPAGNAADFKTRSLDNFNNRTLHHHVFDLELMSAMFNFLQMPVIIQDETEKDLLMLAVKNSKNI